MPGQLWFCCICFLRYIISIWCNRQYTATLSYCFSFRDYAIIGCLLGPHLQTKTSNQWHALRNSILQAISLHPPQFMRKPTLSCTSKATWIAPLKNAYPGRKNVKPSASVDDCQNQPLRPTSAEVPRPAGPCRFASSHIRPSSLGEHHLGHCEAVGGKRYPGIGG